MYPPGSLPQRPNGSPFESGDTSPTSQAAWLAFQGYHAHISAIDDELGRVVTALHDLGLADDTILVYTSDHGTMMGAHGVNGKRQPYEESIRVPFLVRWPGVVSAGADVETLFGSIDIMPTLCGLAGIAVPPSCAGRDFSPALRGERGPDPEGQPIMHLSKKAAAGGDDHPAPLFLGVRTRRYTYAATGDRDWLLFDDERDPYQLHNLVDDAAERDTLRQLRTMVATLPT